VSVPVAKATTDSEGDEMILRKSVRRFVAVAMIVGFMISVPTSLALAHGTPCTPSDVDFSIPIGAGNVKLNSRWECGASHYKWEMRSYAQYRQCDLICTSGWRNTGDNDTNTKTQTTFIQNHIEVRAVCQFAPVHEWQYRIVIQWAKVYNSSLILLEDHSRLNAWASPHHGTICPPNVAR
jgi:hypothetical protein